MLVHRLAKGLLVATLLLIAWGGTVTSTNSGLACGDHWPACFEVRRAEAGEAVRPTLMPRMEGGVLIEHGHRALATAIGMGTIALVIFALLRRPVDPGLRRLAVASLGLVVFQGLLGALTVRMRLPASVTTLHLTFSMAFLGSLVWLVFRSRPGVGPPAGTPGTAAHWTLAAIVLVIGQIVLGAVVRHTGSAPVCAAQFPLCNGQLLPVTLEQIIHVTHRTFAFVVLAVVVIACVRARRAAVTLDRPFVRGLSALVLLLVAAQIGIGIATVWTGIRPVWATLHLTVGALVWVSVLSLHLGLGPLGARAEAAGPAHLRARPVPHGAPA